MKTGVLLFFASMLLSCNIVCAVNYTSNGNGTDWSTPTNWSPNGIPGTSDNVTIQHAITYTGNLNRNGSGTINVNASGTFAVTGNLTLSTSGSSMTVNTGGVVTVGGTMSVNNQSTLNMSGGNVTVTGAMSLGAGTYNGTSGTFKALSFTTTNSGDTHFTNLLNGRIELTGSSTTGNFTSNTAFENYGTIIAPGTFSQSSSGTFKNYGQMSIGSNFTGNGNVQLFPGTTANSKLSVGGIYSVAGGSTTTVGTGVAPGFYADFIVYGNFSQTSGTVNVERNGRLGIFGDLSLSGGGNQFNVNSGGQVYVDGDGTSNSVNLSSGGNNVNNNNATATPQFGLYVNGTVASPGGGSTVDADRANLASLQANNPAFYAFLAAQPGGPLPIKLLYFKVLAIDDHGVTLSWVTTMEKNFNYFELERAGTDLNFETVERLPGKGGLSVNTLYESVDHLPNRGYNYYRLKMVDLDETFEYTSVVAANWNLDRPVSVYPNPVIEHKFKVELNDQMSGPARIQLSDQMGSVVWQYELDEMSAEIQLPDRIEAGLYHARISSAQGYQVINLLIR